MPGRWLIARERKVRLNQKGLEWPSEETVLPFAQSKTTLSAWSLRRVFGNIVVLRWQEDKIWRV